MRVFLIVSLGLAAYTAPAGLAAYTYDLIPVPALVSPPAAVQVYLAPFVDRRRQRDLWKGDTHFERVAVEAEGLDVQAKAWSGWDYQSMSFLWHRELGQALAAAGFAVLEAPAPADGPALVSQAREAGVPYLLDGEIQHLSMDKRGSDSLFGTTFSGVDYTFILRTRVVLVRSASGATILDKDWSYSTLFHDPTPMGRRDGLTFPVYLAAGLSKATEALAQDPSLRVAVGLSPVRSVSTPVSSPSAGADLPYWENPKTGKRMDPSWNFDPADGTPRRDFLLVTPTARP